MLKKQKLGRDVKKSAAEKKIEKTREGRGKEQRER